MKVSGVVSLYCHRLETNQTIDFRRIWSSMREKKTICSVLGGKLAVVRSSRRVGRSCGTYLGVRPGGQLQRCWVGRPY